ncbi:MAG: LamG domain-containing protein, partial [Armatimonadetes bacterium]|nr:LamG domain-containing protein [Armatimonadota bacterium]
MRCRVPAAALGGLLLCLAAVAGAAEEPTFTAHFDGSATATRSDGAPAAPTVARGLTFIPGVTGQAVFVGGHKQNPYEQAPLLEYDAGKLFTGDAGTVMFWVSPDWDGYFTDPVNFDTYFLFAAVGGREAPDYTTRYVAPDSNCSRLWLFMWNWLRLDLFAEPGKPLPTIAWRCRDTWLRGDWWHVAFTWQRDGWSKLYVNGIPRGVQAKTKLDDTQRFYLGSLPKVWNESARANAAFDDLSITSRALSDADINTEFRRVAPLDFTLERRYLRAAEPEELALEISPAGPPVQGNLAVRVLADSDRHVVVEKTFPLQLRARETLRLPLGKLTVGAYRAECTLTRP